MDEIDELLRRWERTIAESERTDPIFSLQAYRVARCLGDLAVSDARRLAAVSDRRTVDQLCRAAISVAANIGEGYGRRGLGDRAKFYGYALGSLRETRAWYAGQAGRLPRPISERREALIARCARLLTGLIRSVQERGRLRFEPKAMD